MRSAAHVGKVGGLALGYFLTMSTVALAIGLVVGNIVQPGAGLHLSEEIRKTGIAQRVLPRAPPSSSSGSSRPRCSPR